MDQESIDTVFSIAICQMEIETLFPTIFDVPSVDSINVFDCRLSGVVALGIAFIAILRT